MKVKKIAWKKWLVIFKPQMKLIGMGYWPDEGKRYRVLQWWVLGPIEVRRFL